MLSIVLRAIIHEDYTEVMLEDPLQYRSFKRKHGEDNEDVKFGYKYFMLYERAMKKLAGMF